MVLLRYRLTNFSNPAVSFISFYVLFLGAGIVVTILRPVEFIAAVPTSIYFIILLYVFLFYVGSHLIAPNLPGMRRRQSQFGYVQDNVYAKKLLLIYRLYLAFGVAFYVLYYWRIGAVPALVANVETARFELKTGSGFLVILGNVFIYAGLVLATTKIRAFNLLRRVEYGFYIVIGLLLLAGTAYRGPAAQLIYLLALAFVFTNREVFARKRLPALYILGGVAFVAFLAVLGFLRKHGRFDSEGFLSIYQMLAVNTYNLENIVSYYSASQQYLYGASFVNDFLTAVPLLTDNQHISLFIKEQLGYEFEGGGVTITAPGEGYINFGLTGVILHALISGTVLGFAYLRLAYKNQLDALVLLLSISGSVIRIPQAGIGATLFFLILPFLSLVYVGLALSRRSHGS